MTSVRIISGKWRSRKISVPHPNAIQPSSDRCRETVFNWLQNHISGANVLDLFCGSGALGFEALSRGAKHATFVDKLREVKTHIHKTAETFSHSGYNYIDASIPKLGTAQLVGPFDIIFMDPPFRKALALPSCDWLHQSSLITPETFCYLEVERELTIETSLEPNWTILKSKTFGQAKSLLLTPIL